MSSRNRYQKKTLRETRRPTGHIPRSKHMYNLSSDDEDDNNDTLKRIQKFDKLFSGGIYSSDDEDYDLECNNYESTNSIQSDLEKEIEITKKPETNTTSNCVNKENKLKENNIKPGIIGIAKKDKIKCKVVINDKQSSEDENINEDEKLEGDNDAL